MSLSKPKRTGNRRTARRSIWELGNGARLSLNTKFSSRTAVQRSLVLIDQHGKQAEVYLGKEELQSLIQGMGEESKWHQSSEPEEGDSTPRPIRRIQR